jgi:hypothetical protein
MTSVLPFQVASFPETLEWWSRRLARPIGSLALATGLLFSTLPILTSTATASTVAANQLSANLADGTYVFGESSTAGQLGVTYMVFQVRSQQVIGGFYQPSSSFDCFQGQITHQELTVTVLPSFEESAYPYSLALEASGQVASQAGVMDTLVPAGFQAVPELSETDQLVLAACQAQV